MPKKIDTLLVPEFIRSRLVAVIYAGTSPPFTEQVFSTFDEKGAATGWVNTDEVSFQWMGSWIHKRQRAIGWPASDRILTGYYLFIDGELRAYHPGLVDFRNDKFSMGFAALVALGTLFAKTNTTLWNAFEAAQMQASLRVISFFTGIIEEFKAQATRVREIPLSPPPPPVDALAQAFAVLGLEESATFADVKQRRMDLVKKWHPDQFATDPDAFAYANAMLAQINAAYGLILTCRDWS
jgi:hypothetical protein